MSNINNLSKQDIEWLLKDYNGIRNYGKVNSWIDWHVKTINLLKGSNEGKPDCSCMYVATAKFANSIYEQHEQALKDKLVELDTPVVKQGRKKNGN